MFVFNPTTSDIDMHIGDTGAYTARATRASGSNWTANDYMVFTIKDRHGTVLLERYYKLSASASVDIEIELKNDDTDGWAAGTYYSERRYVISPVWKDASGNTASAPSGSVVNALTASVHIAEGTVVRVPEFGQSIINMKPIYGEV